MLDKEHEYFHQLIFILQNAAEPKFSRGAQEHRGEGNLWDIPDAQLEQEIQNEILDLMIYLGEKLRRQRENIN